MATRTAIVRPGQTFPDLAVQHCGNVAAWVEIANLNGFGMTEELAPGSVLKLPDPSDKRVVASFKANGLRPAAGDVGNFIGFTEGIGFWAIGVDFEVQ